MTDPVVKPAIPGQRKKRNLAIAIGLVAFVVIVYLVTIIKIHIRGGAS